MKTSIKRRLVNNLNQLLSAVDAQIVKKSEFDALCGQAGASGHEVGALPGLPEGAEAHLKSDNPRLVELKRKYRTFSNPIVDPSVWTASFIDEDLDLRFFRRDGAFVWQARDRNTELKYVLTAYYLQTIDESGFLERLKEDDLFGAQVVNVNAALSVSRDLMDSIVEIYFLKRHLGLSRMDKPNILDIGAGYGRLAHRMSEAEANLGTYLCVDPIAESTFLSEYYLKFRGADETAKVTPFHEIDETLERTSIDLALNIHSFSECTLESTAHWLDLLRKHEVPHLMIVPNAEIDGGERIVSTEKNGTHKDLMPVVEAKRYRLAVKQPKYLDSSVQKYGVSPTYHYLFELAS